MSPEMHLQSFVRPFRSSLPGCRYRLISSKAGLIVRQLVLMRWCDETMIMRHESGWRKSRGDEPIVTQRQGPSPLYYEAGPANPPTLWVEPGEVFEVVTQMNRALDISDVPEDLRDDWLSYTSDDVERANPSSGTIWVRGPSRG